MKDIVPYRQEEALRLGRSLAAMGVPAMGPSAGLSILRIADAVEAAKKNPNLTPDIVELLENYRLRLMDVCNVDAGNQAYVIEQLRKAIG